MSNVRGNVTGNVFGNVIGNIPSIGNFRQQLAGLLHDNSTVAWYQPGVGVTGTLNASAWANQLGAAGSLAQATGANQPIVLPFTGSKYGCFSGVAGNYFSTPDSAAISIIGDLSLVVDIAANDYTPSADQIVASNNPGIELQVLTTGVLRFLWQDNTPATVTFDSTDGIQAIASDASRIQAKITVDADNGAGGTTVRFYTAPTGSSVWTQLGIDVTVASTGVGANPTNAWEVGRRASLGSNLFEGKVYSVKLYDGIDGTLVADFNAADWSETSTNGATQVSSTTGETWTLNNTGALKAQIVGSPSLLFDGTADYMATDVFTLDQPMTAYLVGRQITWTDNDVILDGATADTLGLKQTTTTPKISLNAGAEAAEDANLTLGLYSVITVVLNGASSSIKVNANAATTGNAGAGDPSGLVLGAVVTPGSYSNIQVKELIVRNVADSVATRAKIQALLKSIHGTP